MKKYKIIEKIPKRKLKKLKGKYFEKDEKKIEQKIEKKN